MNASWWRLAPVLVVFGGCGASEAPVGSSGSQFAIEIAPLELPDVTDLCARLTVYNTTNPALMTPGGANTVWSLSDLCADQYGDGRGSLAYVGTCDASGGTAGSPAMNTVELEIEAVLVPDADGGDGEVDDEGTPYDENETDTLAHPADFFNPCRAGSPCRITRPCVENQDTAVDFDLTVMRTARQGFFDVAVTFEDIFCSAKFDCQYPTDEDNDEHDDPIKLLFDADGVRRETGVLAFACTAGNPNSGETGETYLYMSDIVVTCEEDGVVVYEESLPPSVFNDLDGSPWLAGNQFEPARSLESLPSLECFCTGEAFVQGCVAVDCGDPDALEEACDDLCADAGEGNLVGDEYTCTEGSSACEAPAVFQYAIYQGSEFLGAGFEKAYWNVAIGFNVDVMAGRDCTLEAFATASDALVDDPTLQGLPDNETPLGASYPYLHYRINLNEAAGPGLTCGQNPVGLPPLGTAFFEDSGVRPLYTALDAPMSFAHCGHDEGGGFESTSGTCNTPVLDQ